MNIDLSILDDRLDRLVNIDVGGRGVEHLFDAARAQQKTSLVGAAAEALLAVPEGATVLITTGSVSRAWISTAVGENDGPAGAAVIARALVLARHANCVLVIEDTLADAMAAVLTSAGLSVLPADEARAASQDGSLAAVTLAAYPTENEAGRAAAAGLLDDLKPSLLFSTERVGRNAEGIYCSMRGIDYGQGRARIDFVFDEALKRGIPTVAVGDGGNEIGMGNIPEAVRDHVRFGEKICAVTKCDRLVTGACSNWGCSAIAAAMAARTGNQRLLHTAERERQLLLRGVDVGLINSTHGIVDPNVDGIPMSTHLAVVDMLATIVQPALGG
jgi:D-glutamate cyclase